MSDSDKPDVPEQSQPAKPDGAQESPTSEATPPEPAKPDSPPSPAEEHSAKKDLLKRFVEKGRKTTPPGKVPSVEHEQYQGYGKIRDDFDDEMERELQEAMGGLSEDDLFNETISRKKDEEASGQKKAKVYRVHGQDVFMELVGGRTQGLLPLAQFPDGIPSTGTEVEVNIEGYDKENGLYILSRKGSAVEADWESVAIGMTVEARVLETNKGGLSVDVNGIRGFMPISQIELYRVENIDEYVNKKLLCLVAEVDPVMRNLVVSRRGLLEKEREEVAEKLWHELHEGQILTGIVRSVKDFGAFVDLGGVDGLLHVSEMSWERVRNASDVVQIGETVKVVVLKIDRERRKLSLGAKQLLESPWDNVESNYPEGNTVKGKVSRIADFGAFVELEPAIEGLIHISELAPQRVFRVSDIVKVDDAVEVVVLSVDKTQRRIGLSLKAALPQEEVKPTEAVEEEPEEPVKPTKPSKPRTKPLRGGTGDGGPLFKLGE